MDQPREPGGRFAYTLEATHRDAEAVTLRAQGLGFRQIADQLGYADKGEAWRGVQRARKTILQAPTEALIRVEAEQLDELYTAALEVLERDHVMVSHGRIVCDDDGEPLLDDGPKIAAIRELRGLRESYRKLFGLDAPSRVSVDAEKLGAEISNLLGSISQGGNGADSAGD
jgi:hypothetical protein